MHSHNLNQHPESHPHLANMITPVEEKSHHETNHPDVSASQSATDTPNTPSILTMAKGQMPPDLADEFLPLRKT
jgi:hypothetical protein